MRNLHKKISVIVLGGALLVGGVFSQGKVAYASSNRLLSEFELEQPVSINNYDKINSDLAVKEDSKKYGYKVYLSDVDRYKIGNIFHYKDNIDNNKDKLESLLYVYPYLLFSSKHFKSSLDFQSYLKKYGMRKGLYNFWIAGNKYILLFPYDINPRIQY